MTKIQLIAHFIILVMILNAFIVYVHMIYAGKLYGFVFIVLVFPYFVYLLYRVIKNFEKK